MVVVGLLFFHFLEGRSGLCLAREGQRRWIHCCWAILGFLLGRLGFWFCSWELRRLLGCLLRCSEKRVLKLLVRVCLFLFRSVWFHCRDSLRSRRRSIRILLAMVENYFWHLVRNVDHVNVFILRTTLSLHMVNNNNRIYFIRQSKYHNRY